MAERVDVCIVGSGFGGSISAWRLAELYRAAERETSVVVLERGMRKGHTDFRQSLDIDNLSEIFAQIQGSGAQVTAANLVGGASNLYLAASLRAPRETFERRDHNPADGPRRRMWPKEISRPSLNPFYDRAERGLRVSQPGWNQISKAGGVWAAMLDQTGHTCDRVPVAINLDRCVNANWCETGCIFGAKNSLITNYLGAAERAGVEIRPLVQVNEIRQSSARPYRWIVKGARVNPDTKQAAGAITDIECKVLILAAGAIGTTPILLRSRQNLALPAISAQLGKHFGLNGDHFGGIELDRRKVAEVLGLRDGPQFFKGRPINTITYDFWIGRGDHRFDGTRFTLQQILIGLITNFLYDDGRGNLDRPSFWGREKKRSLSTWSDHIEVLALIEETNDGEFLLSPPLGGGHIQPNAGPVGIGLFRYEFSEQSLRAREAADAAIKRIAEHRGIGRFLKLTETKGGFTAHPIGGCRMADSIELGVTNHRCEVFNYEGLFCIDSSVIPTSLGVNPSLTISAVAERAAAKLVRRADRYGLPAAPPGFRHRTPGEFVGERVKP